MNSEKPSAKADRQFVNRINHRVGRIEESILALLEQSRQEQQQFRSAYIRTRLRLVARLLQEAIDNEPVLIHADDLKNMPEAQDGRTDTR